MSKCNIIDQSVLSLNGGEGLYGGTATSFSYTFGTLNSNNRATISISGPNLGRPDIGDSISVGFFGGASFNMDVASYSKSRSKDSSSLTLNLVDRSHRILDQKFVIMNYGPGGFGGSSVYTIGTKRVPKMNDMAGQGVPTPYTSFVKSNKLSDPGVSVGYATNDPLGGTTLEDTFGGIYNGPYPSGPLKYEGSWREVISRLANDAGALPYWDNDAEKVEVITMQNYGGGGVNALIEKIAETCGGNYSISESEDFSVTQASYVIGEMKQEADKQASSEQMGGTTTRWLRAELIDPDFHVGKRGKRGGNTLLDFKNENHLKAIAAAEDPYVFGLYALQSLVDIAGFPDGIMDEPCKLKGRGGNSSVDLSVAGNFEDKKFGYTQNELINDYYLKGKEPPELAGIKILTDGMKIKGPLAQAIADDADKKNEDPIANGFWDKHGLEFLDFDMIACDSNKFKSVIDKNGKINADRDALRNFLLQISRFKNSVYVVQGKKGDGVSGTLPTWNGFFLTAETSLPTMGNAATDGFEHVSLNPFVSVASCGCRPLVDFAKAMVKMYAPKSCHVLDQTMAGEFISQMYKNNISAFITGGGGVGAHDSEKAAAEAGQGFRMHLLIKPPPISEQPSFNPLFKDCHPEAMTVMEDIAFQAKSTQLMGGLKASVDEECSKKLKEEGMLYLKVPHINVHGLLTKFELADPVRIQRMWYNVKCAPSVFNNPALKFSAEGVQGKDSGGRVWAKSLTKVSVSPSDVVTPEMQEAFNDYEEKTGNPGFAIEKHIWNMMTSELKRRMEQQAWVDELTGKSTSITFEGTGGLSTIPSASSGVESISISVSGGKTSTTINSGNSMLKQLISLLRGSTISGNIIFTVPDYLSGAGNNNLSRLLRGLPR